MAKVFLVMSYEIDGNKRNEYIHAIEKLKNHYSTNQYVEYTVSEQKGKQNSFAEIFVAHSEEAFNQFEESIDETADILADKLTQYIKGKIKYTTYIGF